MTGTFAGYGGLGLLTKEWAEYNASRDWTHRMNTFTKYLKSRFPDEAVAYDTYCRLINYQPYNKDYRP